MRQINLLFCALVIVNFAFSVPMAEAKGGWGKGFWGKGRGFPGFGHRSFRSTEQQGINTLHPTGQARATSEHAADALYGVGKMHKP